MFGMRGEGPNYLYVISLLREHPVFRVGCRITGLQRRIDQERCAALTDNIHDHIPITTHTVIKHRQTLRAFKSSMLLHILI